MTLAALALVAGPLVFATGLVAHLLVRDLIRRIIALNVASGGVMMMFLAIAARTSDPDPVPQALVLTGIVIMAATSGVALAFARRVDAESDELDAPDAAELSDERDVPGGAP
ncbi:hypothetical protein GCM10009847_15010 [Leucobacter tardus]|uniref:NADH-quinone oxidoreductase subunit K n=1 Tax=Leucobacter tardus TaxID=501483 RepID=A0A939TUF5_9MICO|nr:NADH-quinone oxidoreductase subunit K [Leucobacter tardus]MBO2989685.1 NADH-quinone oxidoreductase subunit K [Leucobacter tardus]